MQQIHQFRRNGLWVAINLLERAANPVFLANLIEHKPPNAWSIHHLGKRTHHQPQHRV